MLVDFFCLVRVEEHSLAAESSSTKIILFRERLLLLLLRLYLTALHPYLKSLCFYPNANNGMDAHSTHNGKLSPQNLDRMNIMNFVQNLQISQFFIRNSSQITNLYPCYPKRQSQSEYFEKQRLYSE